jgi:hypothetical protein
LAAQRQRAISHTWSVYFVSFAHPNVLFAQILRARPAAREMPFNVPQALSPFLSPTGFPMRPAHSWTTYLLAGFALLVLSGHALQAQAPAEKPPAAKATPAGEKHEGEPVSFWMKKKLELSKNVLEGIASGDCDQIAQSARTMRGLSKIEAFMRARNPGYRGQLLTFEMSLDEIIRQANQNNLEGVTLGFNQLTVSCVQCHKQLRETK